MAEIKVPIEVDSQTLAAVEAFMAAHPEAREDVDTLVERLLMEWFDNVAEREGGRTGPGGRR